jgi:hypothetical protein
MSVVGPTMKQNHCWLAGNTEFRISDFQGSAGDLFHITTPRAWLSLSVGGNTSERNTVKAVNLDAFPAIANFAQPMHPDSSSPRGAEPVN